MARAQRRLAVIGAGPIGLEAALAGVHRGYDVRVYEKGKLADHVHRWGHVRLFSPFGMNCTAEGRAAILATQPQHQFPGNDDLLTGRQHVKAYLEPLASSGLLKDKLRLETQVLHVSRRGCLKQESPGADNRAQHPFLLLVREKGKERMEEAEVVIDASGVYGQHKWLGEGGIPALGEIAAESQIIYGLEDVLGDRRNYFVGKTTMVLGSGYSAATTVCNLAEIANQDGTTWVVWLARGGATQPMRRIMNDALRERDRLAVRANNLATRSDANVEFHPLSVVRGVESLGPDKGFRVQVDTGKSQRAWEVDRIVANVGFQPDTGLYRELQVHECYASQGPMKLAAALAGETGDCLQHKAQGAEALRNPEPNFFILGAKSYGRNPHFLLRTGFEQVREVFGMLG